MWGKLIQTGNILLPRRNAPTGVGKINNFRANKQTPKKHPHDREE